MHVRIPRHHYHLGLDFKDILAGPGYVEIDEVGHHDRLQADGMVEAEEVIAIQIIAVSMRYARALAEDEPWMSWLDMLVVPFPEWLQVSSLTRFTWA